MSEKEASAEEQREAEALAAELDGRTPPSVAPADALETAALLKAGQAGMALSPERSEALLEQVLDSAPPRSSWLGIGRLLPMAAALAAVVLLILVFTGKTPGPETVLALPRPGPELLQAQAAATAGDIGKLRAEMHSYRRELYAALALRYRGRP